MVLIHLLGIIESIEVHHKTKVSDVCYLLQTSSVLFSPLSHHHPDQKGPLSEPATWSEPQCAQITWWISAVFSFWTEGKLNDSNFDQDAKAIYTIYWVYNWCKGDILKRAIKKFKDISTT